MAYAPIGLSFAISTAVDSNVVCRVHCTHSVQNAARAIDLLARSFFSKQWRADSHARTPNSRADCRPVNADLYILEHEEHTLHVSKDRTLCRRRSIRGDGCLHYHRLQRRPTVTTDMLSMLHQLRALHRNHITRAARLGIATDSGICSRSACRLLRA